MSLPSSTLNLSMVNIPITAPALVPTPAKSTAVHPYLHLQSQHGQCEHSSSTLTLAQQTPSTPSQHQHFHQQYKHCQHHHSQLPIATSMPASKTTREAAQCTQPPTPMSTFDVNTHLHATI
ncbi:hypothetical protein BDQ12DRAFT_728171 [Crucibulum laeve]|uniref:Uncharacterized protein n=1 Tax=Crucibulum laeve TaxID=68775 RepID=A0A5C3LJQ0_9AGAR|nr:hypothetical protein BDQ12DRAFT_728171 [Crucibulum laeve]